MHMQLSILIRNLNESKQLEQTLLALKKQVTDFDYEVVVIDNESDDDSVAVAERMGCKVLALPREEFTFGRALNFGINQCKGEIVLILSSHVILLNEFFLQQIPKYFNEEKVAALRFIHAIDPKQVFNGVKFGPKELYYMEFPCFPNNNWRNFLVNHCGAIRKACWKQEKFNEKIFSSEDKLWSLNILKKGYYILYNIPCYYVYTKELNRERKIKGNIRQISAKAYITGQSSEYHQSFLKFVFIKTKEQLKHLFVQLFLFISIYRGIKKFNKNYTEYNSDNEVLRNWY